MRTLRIFCVLPNVRLECCCVQLFWHWIHSTNENDLVELGHSCVPYGFLEVGSDGSVVVADAGCLGMDRPLDLGKLVWTDHRERRLDVEAEEFVRNYESDALALGAAKGSSVVAVAVVAVVAMMGGVVCETEAAAAAAAPYHWNFELEDASCLKIEELLCCEVEVEHTQVVAAQTVHKMEVVARQVVAVVPPCLRCSVAPR